MKRRELRVGQGIDVHVLVEGRPLILGGVTIPHDRGLLGHSDADVLLHSLTDALLGAIGSGDIGTLFPNTDSAWKDASSLVFVTRAMELVRQANFGVVNIDATILAEEPKILPFVPQMKTIIARALDLETSRVGIKATTFERLGFVGRREGIMAQCVVLLSNE